MKNTMYMTVDEIAKEIQCSKAYAYKVCRQLNEELATKGYLTIAGKLPRKFFYEKCYGVDSKK